MSDVPKLFRLILQVSDLARAVNFYSTLLGNEGRSIRGSRHYFDCGQVILALVDHGPEAKPIPDNVYLSVTDVEAIFARAKGLECLSSELVHGDAAGEIVKRPWGEVCFYVTDPFGNGLCFVDETTLFTGR